MKRLLINKETLIICDVILGTKHLPVCYTTIYGIENNPKNS